MKKVGRVGAKALIYFEVVSGIALIIGLIVANVLQPGAGFNADPATLDANAVADYAKRASSETTMDFVLGIIPTTFLDAFTSGDTGSSRCGRWRCSWAASISPVCCSCSSCWARSLPTPASASCALSSTSVRSC